MLNKLLFVIALGVFSGVASAPAQTLPAQPTPTPAAGAPVRVKGKIIAARVQGHVEATSTVAGAKQTVVLHDGDAVTDDTQVVTAPGASVILIFSNGATVDVAPDSTLKIDEFEQDPFGADVKVADLKQEPGTSTTRLNLTKGALVGKVVHLNVDKGSEFTVATPVGAAGIRGTTFQIVYRPGPNGTALFSVVTAEGQVVFTGTAPGSTPVDISAGQQIVVTFDVDSGLPTAPIVLSDLSPAEAAQIQTISQAIINSMLGTTFSGTGGGAGTSTVPSIPAPPPPITTPGAGGP